MSAENETLVATQLAQQLEEKKENAALVDFKMVTFSLADKDYARYSVCRVCVAAVRGSIDCGCPSACHRPA